MINGKLIPEKEVDMSSFLFERDLLYPTDNILEPGILHISILNPRNSKMPVVVEPKSNHSAVKYIDSILELLQKDIFDRINIRVYDNTLVYIMLNESDKEEYGSAKCVKVVYKVVHEYTLVEVDGEEYESLL